ncbi:MAG: hypothetical protein HY335_07715 [Deinococcus sp.]|nr:hypothetical protein [Deinococcus sp.]
MKRTWVGLLLTALLSLPAEAQVIFGRPSETRSSSSLSRSSSSSRSALSSRLSRSTSRTSRVRELEVIDDLTDDDGIRRRNCALDDRNRILCADDVTVNVDGQLFRATFDNEPIIAAIQVDDVIDADGFTRTDCLEDEDGTLFCAAPRSTSSSSRSSTRRLSSTSASLSRSTRGLSSRTSTGSSSRLSSSRSSSRRLSSSSSPLFRTTRSPGSSSRSSSSSTRRLGSTSSSLSRSTSSLSSRTSVGSRSRLSSSSRSTSDPRSRLGVGPLASGSRSRISSRRR